MGSTLEMIIVGVVVGAALIWAVVAGWRSVKKQGACSSCGSSGECPLANNPEALAELTLKDDQSEPSSPAENLHQDAPQ
jgi:hypothetical protein